MDMDAADVSLAEEVLVGQHRPLVHPRLLCVGVALQVGVLILERVQGDHLTEAAVLPLGGRGAVVLNEERVLVHALRPDHLHEALVHEHILAPVAVTGADVPEVLLALVDVVDPLLHSVCGEHLDGAVQAELAVVEVDAFRGLLVLPDNRAQARGEEDGVWIDLHRPLVRQEPLVFVEPLPHLDEDIRVQRCPELSTQFALEVHVDNNGVHAGRHLHRTVAVELVLVTVEDPRAELVLRAEEAGLVVAGVRAEEREAVQRLPLGRPVELQSPALHDARHEVPVRDLREELPGCVALQGARVGELAAVPRVPVAPCPGLALGFPPAGSAAVSRVLDVGQDEEGIAGVAGVLVEATSVALVWLQHSGLDTAVIGQRNRGGVFHGSLGAC
mmetsp:Transcript_57558/g.169076  ORF Transcript_57558/g.169076 Transcript_57558/m.169076 type:complete len:387 (+) Transcript_57558:1959-3119(+)